MKLKSIQNIKTCASGARRDGFTLIEAVLSVFIISILVVAILGMFSFALRLVMENKLLVQAIALGEEKLEIIKNLSYDNVGTVSGIPSGVFPQNEIDNVNGTDYSINYYIVYVDDPADGISPTDFSGTDYKKVRMQISWTGPMGNQTQTFVTSISPKRNHNVAGTGTLSIVVFNASGQAVPQANVRVQASFATSTVDINTQTNSLGRVVIPGAPAGTNKYSIVTTKTNYSTDRTCSIDVAGAACTDAVGNPVPTKANASVIEGDFNEIGFAIDIVSQLNIRTIRQSVAADWVINTDATAYDQDNPSMAICPDGSYIFTWRDKRQNDNPRIYAQKYDANRIKQWNPDLALTTANNQNNPDVAVDKDCYIYVVWNDDRNGNQDIYFSKINSSGNQEWGEGKKVDTQAESADQTIPQIIINASSTFEYIIWQDSRNDVNDIYAQKFTPAGNGVWASEKRINTDATTATQGMPKIQIDTMIIEGNENLYFAWYDNRNSNNDIFSQKYNQDGNNVWANDTRINTDATTTEQMNPDFVISNDNYLYYTWQDARFGNYDIFSQKYDTNGAKIWANDVRINSDIGESSQDVPAIIEDNSNNFYIVWEDNRYGNSDIFMQKIDSDGNKLIEFDTRINQTNSNEQGNPDIFINKNGFLTVTWQDNNGGNLDIKAAVYNIDPQIITNIGNVPLSIHGIKKIGENPVIYKYSNNFSTNANGTLTLSGLEWDDYPIVASTYNILTSDPPLPIILNADQTINVILNLE